ncbi:hypothetical protein ACJ41O_000696 [Fusarium nematophilum]
MAFRSTSGKILATSLVAAVTAGGAYSFMIHRRISLADRRQITRFDDIPESFEGSRSVSEIVNAGKHTRMADSRFISIDIPTQHRHVSDEVLLAKFTRGYFGGLVIGPERVALQTLGLNLVHFTRASPTTTSIWSLSDLHDTQLPPLHSVIFGTFQTLDTHIAALPCSAESRSQSYIDFGFGSDEAGFAGVHRFAVVRSGDDGQTVQIHCQSMSCNPRVDRPLRPRWMFAFHKAYADLLFREGVSEIKRWLGQ